MTKLSVALAQRNHARLDWAGSQSVWQHPVWHPVWQPGEQLSSLHSIFAASILPKYMLVFSLNLPIIALILHCMCLVLCSEPPLTRKTAAVWGKPGFVSNLSTRAKLS